LAGDGGEFLAVCDFQALPGAGDVGVGEAGGDDAAADEGGGGGRGGAEEEEDGEATHYGLFNPRRRMAGGWMRDSFIKPEACPPPDHSVAL